MKTIGYWDYPRTFYTHIDGRKIIGVKVSYSRNAEPKTTGVCEGENDRESSDHYSTTLIWLEKYQAPKTEISKSFPYYMQPKIAPFMFYEAEKLYIPTAEYRNLSTEEQKAIAEK